MCFLPPPCYRRVFFRVRTFAVPAGRRRPRPDKRIQFRDRRPRSAVHLRFARKVLLGSPAVLLRRRRRPLARSTRQHQIALAARLIRAALLAVRRSWSYPTPGLSRKNKSVTIPVRWTRFASPVAVLAAGRCRPVLFRFRHSQSQFVWLDPSISAAFQVQIVRCRKSIRSWPFAMQHRTISPGHGWRPRRTRKE